MIEGGPRTTYAGAGRREPMAAVSPASDVSDVSDVSCDVSYPMSHATSQNCLATSQASQVLACDVASSLAIYPGVIDKEVLRWPTDQN